MFVLLFVLISVALSADKSLYDLTACSYTECHGMFSTARCPSEHYLVKWEKCGILKKHELCCRMPNSTSVDKCRWGPCHATIENHFCSQDEYVSEERKCSLFRKQEKCCKQENIH